jgi:hypothetical protein
MTREAIKAGTFPVEVLVETVTSRENVKRFAEKNGLRVAVNERGDAFRLTITKVEENDLSR